MSAPSETSDAGSTTRASPAGLRGLVSAYHGYHYRLQAAGVHHGLPTTALTVVIAFDQPIDVGWLDDPSSRGRHWALASGMSVRPAGIHHAGTQHGIQLDLSPSGARALLGVPASALANAIVPLEDLLGEDARRLCERLAIARGWAERFALLDTHLLALADVRRRPASGEATLSQAWRRLHETAGRLPVAELARQVGLSRRHLTARFTGEYGITPKQASRLVRFSTARALVTGARPVLADVAARCGYADQAHLTREWRELAGVPPARWLIEERPFLQDRSNDG
jgi:AraC-like DNA-binding protein